MLDYLDTTRAYQKDDTDTENSDIPDNTSDSMKDLEENIPFKSIVIPDPLDFKPLSTKKLSDIPKRSKTVHLSLDSKMVDDYEEKSEPTNEFGQEMENLMEDHAQQNANTQIDQTNTVDIEEF
jgi:predicted nucleotidyltransferase